MRMRFGVTSSTVSVSLAALTSFFARMPPSLVVARRGVRWKRASRSTMVGATSTFSPFVGFAGTRDFQSLSVIHMYSVLGWRNSAQ